jgi:tritrans,polycis-undecaprenyl-diphosphate synthase [geranylgeranyl-diphosphate specific]
MEPSVRALTSSVYSRLFRRQIADAPEHVAVIQDGNRRYARESGADPTDGHREGADTTEQVLEWCQDLGVAELTLYTFSVENFERPDEELESLFELIERKLYEFADADRVHDEEVRIRVIGEPSLLPDGVQAAVEYAEAQTAEYDQFWLNIALAYGGRTELLKAAREVLRGVDRGDQRTDDIDVETVESHLYDRPVREVDLVIRTGSCERTSNFLPWYANGSEAAVFFCTPYWPEFSKVDFLRAIRTYEARAESWRQTRIQRALTLVQTLSDLEVPEARRVLRTLTGPLTEPDSEPPVRAIHEASDPETTNAD